MPSLTVQLIPASFVGPHAIKHMDQHYRLSMVYEMSGGAFIFSLAFNSKLNVLLAGTNEGLLVVV